MKKKFSKKLVTITIALVLCLALAITAFAAEAFGGWVYFTEAGYSYGSRDSVFTSSGFGISAWVRLESYSGTRPIGYLYADTVLLKQDGTLVQIRSDTNTTPTAYFMLGTDYTNVSGGYYAEGGVQVYRNGGYSTWYFLGQSPLLYI